MVSTELSKIVVIWLGLTLTLFKWLSLPINGWDVVFTTVFGLNSGASALSRSGWLYAACGSKEATWTTGTSAIGGSLEDSLFVWGFCWRLACFRRAWCRSHLYLSRFCLDGGFCFLAGLGWWVAAICPGWPYLVRSFPWMTCAATGSKQLLHVSPVS